MGHNILFGTIVTAKLPHRCFWIILFSKVGKGTVKCSYTIVYRFLSYCNSVTEGLLLAFVQQFNNYGLNCFVYSSRPDIFRCTGVLEFRIVCSLAKNILLFRLQLCILVYVCIEQTLRFLTILRNFSQYSRTGHRYKADPAINMLIVK